MKTVIRADKIQVGDVIAGTGSRGPISVKQVIVSANPVFRTTEIKILGPMNIIEKYHADAKVTMLRVGGRK